MSTAIRPQLLAPICPVLPCMEVMTSFGSPFLLEPRTAPQRTLSPSLNAVEPPG